MTTSSLERIYPANNSSDEHIGGFDTLRLHKERYHFAGKHLVSGAIADVACGAGYGSYILATEYGDKIKNITAIDNSTEAIRFAINNYTHPLISFVQTDAVAYQSEEPFQTIISLETIEHLEDPSAFIRHYARQLVSGGHFIASVPVVPTKDANPYHLHDFTTSSFRKLFTDAGFVEKFSMIQVQRYDQKSIRKNKEGRSGEIRKNLPGYYLKNPGKFLLRIFSILKDGFTIKYMVAVFEKK